MVTHVFALPAGRSAPCSQTTSCSKGPLSGAGSLVVPTTCMLGLVFFQSANNTVSMRAPSARLANTRLTVVPGLGDVDDAVVSVLRFRLIVDVLDERKMIAMVERVCEWRRNVSAEPILQREPGPTHRQRYSRHTRDRSPCE